MHVFKVSRRRYNSKCHDLYIRIKKTLNCNKSLKMICHLSPYQTLLLLLLLAISSLAAGECSNQFLSHYLAVSYTILSLLPHVFALVTLVYHLLHHIRCVRTVFTTMSAKISVILHGAPDVTESLPDRLQNSYAYRTLPPIL